MRWGLGEAAMGAPHNGAQQLRYISDGSFELASRRAPAETKRPTAVPLRPARRTPRRLGWGYAFCVDGWRTGDSVLSAPAPESACRGASAAACAGRNAVNLVPLASEC